MDNKNLWNTNRNDLINTGITSLFVAFNKPLQIKMIDSKTDMLSQTLINLDDNKISHFFRFLRENFDRFPSDAEMSKALRVNHKKFCRKQEEVNLIEYSFTSKDVEKLGMLANKYPKFKPLLRDLVKETDPPSQQWREQFFAMVSVRENFY